MPWYEQHNQGNGRHYFCTVFHNMLYKLLNVLHFFHFKGIIKRIQVYRWTQRLLQANVPSAATSSAGNKKKIQIQNALFWPDPLKPSGLEVSA
ncbi:hypothetical protein ACJX0J_018615, partial [Zea mays]